MDRLKPPTRISISARLKRTLLSQEFWINALALAISSIPYGMFLEIGIWQWTFVQSFWSRMGGIPADMVLGGPYGIWRSTVLGKMKAGEGKNWLWNWFAGSLAFASYQIPIYLAIIFATWLWIPLDQRATFSQIAGSCATLVITSTLGDRLFAWVVMILRWCFGIKHQT